MTPAWRWWAQSPWLTPASVALLTWVCLLSGLYPSVHWYDTGEWIAAPRALSLAHPPGHPLTLMSAHLAQLAPWLDVYGRANLASALWLSLASAFTAAAMGAMITELGGWRRELIAGLVGLYLPALPFVWLQGVRAEVYAPQCALSALCLCAWAHYQRQGDLRWLLMGGLSIGLQASNHTLLAVAVTAPLSLWLAIRTLKARPPLQRQVELPKLSSRVLLYIFGSASAGLSLYLLLPLRGEAGGVEGWGYVHDLSSFWETLSASVWRRSVLERSATVSLLENLARFSAFMITQLGPLSALLALVISLLASLRWLRDGHWGAPLTLTAVWSSVSMTKLSYPFLEVNPDFSGYLSAGAPALCLLLGLSCLALSPRLAALCLTALVAGAGAQPRAHGSPESYSAEAWARALTEEVPLRGALWSSHYATHFGLSALRVAEGWRPDLALIFRGYRHEPWAQERLKTSLNELPQEVSSPFQARARLEVEGALDQLPELRSRARATGLTWGVTPWVTAPPISQLKAGLELLKRRGRDGEEVDIDTAYGMALFHEAHLVWLSRGEAQLSPDQLGGLIELHRAARDNWLQSLPE